CQQESNWSYSF
nr:immunoglobulin light chain junction region [Macaca mulatta]MOX08661.1 immunoglobulin light chain junction region [Macaca mulatta]MOX09530.1 immunoglobulin light chain junction region [Macaca mulatta]